MELSHIILAGLIGLAAGVVGGLSGIGGSMVMLPGLAIVFGYAGDPTHGRQHLYQAAAMAVNVVVAGAAAMEHHRAGTVRRDLVVGLLPAMAAGMIAGVLISNQVDGRTLARILAAFIACYCLYSLWRALLPHHDDPRGPERTSRVKTSIVGSLAGLVGGLVGLGGGVVTVPALQVLERIPLRQAISASAATMWMTALIGSAIKLGSLPSLGQSPVDALVLIGAMAPCAVGGAIMGARLTHGLPLRAVRLVVSLLLLLAAARMAGVL